jgi:hypothetical protein
MTNGNKTKTDREKEISDKEKLSMLWQEHTQLAEKQNGHDKRIDNIEQTMQKKTIITPTFKLKLWLIINPLTFGIIWTIFGGTTENDVACLFAGLYTIGWFFYGLFVLYHHVGKFLVK